MASAQIQGNKWLIENQAQQTKNKCVSKTSERNWQSCTLVVSTVMEHFIYHPIRDTQVKTPSWKYKQI